MATGRSGGSAMPRGDGRFLSSGGFTLALMSDLDRIPALDHDPDAPARALREARRGIVVVLSPNTIRPLPDAEVAVVAGAGAGISEYVVGWRRARGPEELASGYQAIWAGPDVDPLEGWGQPFCWGVRTPGGVGALSALMADQFGPYEESMRRAAEAQRSA